MRILLIEDEAKTAALLRQGLHEQGFTVEIAGDGELGLRKALNGGFALIILDLMLPKLDGWAVLREIKLAKLSTQILILTARDGVQERVRGLEAGADDYLVKPFAFAELLARVRARLRADGAGKGGGEVHEWVIDDLRIDRLRHSARRGIREIPLTPTEYALLELLAQAEGQAVTRDTIAREVWGVKHAGDSNAVDVALFRLRRKVDDDGAQRLIHAVRGTGYRLAVE